MMSEPQQCLSCGCKLFPRDIREVVAADGRLHGPFCVRCTQRAEGAPSFAQWLDDEWLRQNPH